MAHPPVEAPAYQRFMSSLTPTLRRQVAALPEVLEAHRDDFVVFTARKAVCLADALARLGYWQPRGDFTSNRALDGDLAALGGRKVVIVEDMAASCRTLKSAIDVVARAGPAETLCFALSVEGARADWEKTLGVKFVSPYLQSRIDQSLAHTRSLVESFAALPRPYNVDWPTYAADEPLSIERILDRGWRLGSPVDLDFAGPTSFEISEALRDRLRLGSPGWLKELFAAAHLTKVRVYPVPRPAEAGTKFFVVPIVAIGSVTDSEVRHHLDALAGAVDEPPIYGWSTRERYRALQFLLGEVLLQIFCSATGYAAPAADSPEVSYLFLGETQADVRRLQAAIRRRAAASPFATAASMSSVARTLTWEQVAQLEREQRTAEATLSNIFSDGYVQSEEFRLRLKLRESEANRPQVMRDLVALNRASDGASFTAGELRRRLTADAGREDGLVSSRDLVSSFLDRAIDAGEVVPEISVGDAGVERRFRPGEIINFERDNQAAVEVMLRSFADSIGDRRMSALLVQKLIVGYVHYLVYQSRMADERTAGVSAKDAGRLQRRYHIRGAVLDEVGSDFIGHNREPQSVVELESRGVLERVDGGYEIADEPALIAPDRLTVDATVFGQVCAEILSFESRSENRAKLVSTDDFGRLVSLVTAEHQTFALGADLGIALRGLSTTDFSDGAAFRRSWFYQAINNGLVKAFWVERGVGASLLRGLDKRFAGQDPLNAAVRHGVVAAFVPEDGNSAARQLMRRLTGWFRDAWIYCAWIEYELDGFSAEALERAQERLLNNRSYLGIRGKGRLSKPLSVLAEAILDDLDLGTARDKASEARAALENDGQSYLERCHELNSDSAASLPKRGGFESCLLVHTRGGSVEALGSITGVRGAVAIDGSHDDSCLAHYDVVFPLTPNFSLSRSGAQLVAMLQTAGADGVLLHSMVPRFRPYHDPGDQIVRPSRPFLELVAAGDDVARRSGPLTVVVPKDSAADAARYIRRVAENVTQVDVLDSEWIVGVCPGDQPELEFESLPVEATERSPVVETRRRLTAGILTALPEELRGVRDYLVHRGAPVERKTNDVTGGVYYVSEFQGESVDWTICAAFTDARGNEAASGTAEAVVEWRPDVLIYLGIAGGVPGDVALGDVVAATSVFDYDARKETSGGPIPRLSERTSTYGLSQLAAFVQMEDRWPEAAIDHQKLADQRPKAHLEPIAAGAAVVASSDGQTFRLVQAIADRVVAFETEGSAFLSSVARHPGVEGIVIRGISDLLDNKAESDKQGIRKQATSNAAAFAFELLNLLQPRSKQR